MDSPSTPARPELLSGFHSRGHLPHLKSGNATYFVTFRLADSLPATAVAKLKEDRSRILANAAGQGRPLTWPEQQELLAWYSDSVDRLLDSGAGACWPARPDIAEAV